MKIVTNQPPSIVIVKFNQSLYVVASFPVSAVHEFPRFLQTEAYVVTATAPLPTVLFDRRGDLRDRGGSTATWFGHLLYQIVMLKLTDVVINPRQC